MKSTPPANVSKARRLAARFGLRGVHSAPVKSVAGRIIADPNPLPSEMMAPGILRWETNASRAEVTVTKNDAPETRVSRSPRRSYDVKRIPAGSRYVFRLYDASEPRTLLDEIEVTRKCSGKIRLRSSPNPLSFEGKALLEWEVTSPVLAEVCICERDAAEKLIHQGGNGAQEIDYLRLGVDYSFRLYSHLPQRPDFRELLDEVSVRWENTAENLATLVARHVPRLFDKNFPGWSRMWEESGFHVTPVHFYSPIPDTKSLPDLWTGIPQLPGIDLNPAMQLQMLRDIFPRFRAEYEEFPLGPSPKGASFYRENGRFDGLDPMLAYSVIRHFKPRRIVEVGGGYSTLLLRAAAERNCETELLTIEPYPEDFLRESEVHLLQQKVQELELSFFERLQEGDCLFIDSSHVVKIGSDVNYLFLQVLPRLKPDVLVHVHDIFLPMEYPRGWVIDRRRFWNEQYLLQAFLAFNTSFEVMVSSGFLNTYHQPELMSAFPGCAPWSGGSFWMRRKPALPDPKAA